MARNVASVTPGAGPPAGASESSPNVDEVVGAVGPKLRELRRSHGLSLQQLAARSQVSAAAIHKVERGEMVPTITTLLKLSAALGRPVSYFIDELPEIFDVATYVAADQRTPIDTPVRGLTLEGLSGPTTRFRLRGTAATIAPGVSCDREIHVGGGEQLMVVLAGSLVVEVQGRPYDLGPRDSLHLPTDRAHRWTNPGPQTTRVLWVSLPDR